jgi:hypothetical protein
MLDDCCVAWQLLLLYLHAELLLRILLVVRKGSSVSGRRCHHRAHELVVRDHGRLYRSVLTCGPLVALLHTVRVLVVLLAGVLVSQRRGVAVVKALRVNITPGWRLLFRLCLRQLGHIILIVVSPGHGRRAVALVNLIVAVDVRTSGNCDADLFRSCLALLL